MRLPWFVNTLLQLQASRSSTICAITTQVSILGDSLYISSTPSSTHIHTMSRYRITHIRFSVENDNFNEAKLMIAFDFIMIFIMIVVTIIGIFLAITYLLIYTLGFLYISSSGSANAQLPGCFHPWTFSLNIGLNMFLFDFFMSCLHSLLTRLFYRGVPGFATDCPWINHLLQYVGPLFGNLVENDSRFVNLP